MRAMMSCSLAGLLLGASVAVAEPLILDRAELDAVAAGQFNCLALGCPGSPPAPIDLAPLPFVPPGTLPPLDLPVLFPRLPHRDPGLQPQICPPLCGGFPFPIPF